MLDLQVAEFVSRQCGASAGQVVVAVRTVRGGLESQVARAIITAAPGAAPLALPRRFVVKELRGRQRRETDIYRLVARRLATPPTARLLGEQIAGDAAYLFMEDVRGRRRWPWNDLDVAAHVCQILARFHDEPLHIPADWNYDRELQESARETLALAERVHAPRGVRCFRRLGDLRRVVDATALIRGRLHAEGTTLIHGDVHPGNVVVAGGGAEPRIVLLDWGRARPGSPLEDVAGWLESLACWEPLARRRHDTLLHAYLNARRDPERLDSSLRARYWLAAAANGLGGAIRYHLAALGNPLAPARTRREASFALPSWERVIRRAAEVIGASATADSRARRNGRVPSTGSEKASGRRERTVTP